MAAPEVGAEYNGVLLLGEALGQAEAVSGTPFAGMAGFTLQQLLDRVGWKRAEFALENAIRCRPPANAIVGESYEWPALRQCRSHYKRTIDTLKPKVVVALGATALIQALDLPERPTLDDHLGYVQYGPEGVPVIATWHPAFITRGNWNLSEFWRWHLRNARTIAAKGFQHKDPHTLVDPPVEVLRRWVEDYELAQKLLRVGLAYDIETEHSAKTLEDEFDLTHASYNILRISFAFRPGEGVSIPWSVEYMPLIKRLLGSTGDKFVWNGNYDDPRIEAHGVEIRGRRIDLMWAWHSWESDGPKNLGFVTPLLLPYYRRWKHLSGSQPGYYSAVDGAAEWDLSAPILSGLKADRLYEQHEGHVINLTPRLRQMSAAGMPISQERRLEVFNILWEKMVSIREAMASCVPMEQRRFNPAKGFVRDPEDTQGLVQITVDAVKKCCTRCWELGVTKTNHTGKKTLLQDGVRVPNPCFGAEISTTVVPTQRWTRLLPWTPSNKALQEYSSALGHRPVTKGGRITFDDEALVKLTKRYPNEPMYRLVQDYRRVEKLQGTNVGFWNGTQWEGGPPVGADSRIHTIYNFNPSTARLASQSPNLTNIPRRGDYADLIRSLFVAEPGHVLYEADFSAIEAVLVGYFALDPTYIRMSKLGIHDFLNAQILYRDKKITELVDPKWSDADLKGFFGELKRRFKEEREIAKRIIHGGNYGMTPNRMNQVYPETFPTIAIAAGLQQFYFEVFPSIPQWQNRTIEQASRVGELRTPFGNRHRFWKCYNWSRVWDEREDKWRWEKDWADDAKRALAFLPQSTAAGIIKEAILALPAHLMDHLRLVIHDSLLSMFPAGQWEELGQEMQDIMRRPIPCLPLPEEWGLGPFLSIGTEAKASPLNWAEVADV